MRKSVLSVVSILAVAFAMSMPVAAQTGSGTPAGKMGKMDREGNERHPMIRQAIKSLEKAKWDLSHAAHDFGGHREDALKACDNAIEQLELALQADKK